MSVVPSLSLLRDVLSNAHLPTVRPQSKVTMLEATHVFSLHGTCSQAGAR